MARPATGSVEYHEWKDGRTVSWWLRVRCEGQRYRVDLGTNHEGWNEQRAEVELEKILGQIERGTWEPPSPKPEPEPTSDIETIHLTASRWWKGKKAEKLEKKTEVDYEWRLAWILKYKPHDPTSEVDAEWVDEFKVWLSEQISEKTGETLSSRSQNMVLSCLAALLDTAVRHKVVPANAARGKGTRVREKKKKKRFLLPDQVVDLLDAAGEWETELPKNQRFGRRAQLATLVLAGPRVEELAVAELAELDVHSEILRVDRSKTEAGERDIDLTAYLLGEVRPHMAALPAILGCEPTPRTPIYPTRNGKRRHPDNVRRYLREVVKKANEKRAERGKLLIPEGLTPHDLRRTFACLCFWAGRELPYVKAQIGHKDGRMTLEAYAFASERKRVDRRLVWELMRFSDEPDLPPWMIDPLNDPTPSREPSGRLVSIIEE